MNNKKIPIKKLLVLFVVSLFSYASFSQIDTSKPKKKSWLSLQQLANSNISFLIFPSVTFSPETSLKFGAVADYFYNVKGNKQARLSSSWAQLLYSTRGQITFNGATTTYTKNEKYYIQAKAGYLYNYERFWGFTNNTLSNNNYVEVNYYKTYASLQVLRNIGNKNFTGLSIHYNTNYDFSIDSLGKNSINFGENIMQSNRLLGAGLHYIVDQRNNQFTATNGMYIEISDIVFFNPQNFQYQYNQLTIDIRKYIEKQKHVWAFQLYNNHQIGTVPVFEQNKLGGHQQLRGVFSGRFRDQSMYYAQVEYRYAFANLFRLAGFASFGNTAPNVINIFSTNMQSSIGTGLRFLLNQKKGIYLRGDIAYSAIGQLGYYFKIGDAF